jgi:hypothetical protein
LDSQAVTTIVTMIMATVMITTRTVTIALQASTRKAIAKLTRVKKPAPYAPVFI